MKGIRKFLILALSLFIVFSSCLMISAENDSVGSKFVDITADFSVLQDENGDLVISASGDKSEELITSLYNGSFSNQNDGSTSSSYIILKHADGYYGYLVNSTILLTDGNEIREINLEKVDSNTLKISKKALVDAGFIDGNYTITIEVINEPGVVQRKIIENVSLTTGLVVTPNRSSKLKIEGIKEPVEGESTDVDVSNIKLTDENRNEIPYKNNDDNVGYSIYWAEPVKAGDEIFYIPTYDEIFKSGKTYYLVINYYYSWYGSNNYHEKELITVDYKDHVFANADNISFSYITTRLYTTSLTELSSAFVPTTVEYVAEIEDEKYETLSGAVLAAKDKDTIKMIADTDISTNGLIIDKTITLDLNGHNIFVANTNEGNIKVQGILTLKDSTDANKDGTGKGKLYSTTKHSVLTGYTAISVESGGTFNMVSGLIETYNDKKHQSHYPIGTIDSSGENDANVFISGGKITSMFDIVKIKNDETFKGTISISGGSFLIDVSEYLAPDYNIVKLDNNYKVVKNGTEVKVEKTTAAVSNGAREIINKLIEGSIKDENGNAVTVNSSTKINLNSTDITDETKKEEAIKKAKSAVSEKTGSGYIPLDITLTATNITDGQTKITTITDLGEGNDITVTLYLDNDTLTKLSGSKNIKVVRIHKGTDGVEEIKELGANLNGNILTFKTSKFSTYVIAYSNTSSSSSSTKYHDPKDKNQDGIITCDEEMNSANWVWSTSKNACVYKVSNTSVR